MKPPERKRDGTAKNSEESETDETPGVPGVLADHPHQEHMHEDPRWWVSGARRARFFYRLGQGVLLDLALLLIPWALLRRSTSILRDGGA